MTIDLEALIALEKLANNLPYQRRGNHVSNVRAHVHSDDLVQKLQDWLDLNRPRMGYKVELIQRPKGSRRSVKVIETLCPHQNLTGFCEKCREP